MELCIHLVPIGERRSFQLISNISFYTIIQNKIYTCFLSCFLCFCSHCKMLRQQRKGQQQCQHDFYNFVDMTGLSFLHKLSLPPFLMPIQLFDIICIRLLSF